MCTVLICILEVMDQNVLLGVYIMSSSKVWTVKLSMSGKIQSNVLGYLSLYALLKADFKVASLWLDKNWLVQEYIS